MNTVTGRIKEIKQPRGGYIKPSEFDVIQLNDNKELYPKENVSANNIGMVVDYMTRFMMENDVEKAFEISIMGAICAEKLGKKNAINEIKKYIKKINGLDNESIINACKCVNYDVWFRNPMYALMYESETVIPDPYTINNIKIMIERSISFWKQYGPIEVSGFTFEEDGYTETVSSGDGDYLTKDTLWDFKVSKYDIKSNHTLQLLMYYIMGKHSKKEEYKTINKIGVFNPRLNKIYILETNKIPKDIIEAVEKDVICY